MYCLGKYLFQDVICTPIWGLHFFTIDSFFNKWNPGHIKQQFTVVIEMSYGLMIYVDPGKKCRGANSHDIFVFLSLCFSKTFSIFHDYTVVYSLLKIVNPLLKNNPGFAP